jgi:hypothetical protein
MKRNESRISRNSLLDNFGQPYDLSTSFELHFYLASQNTLSFCQKFASFKKVVGGTVGRALETHAADREFAPGKEHDFGRKS